MELNELEFIANSISFAADGMIHAVQPMAPSPRGRQRAIRREDTDDDPNVCLTCPYEDCRGTEKCYKKRKKEMEEKKK